MKKIIISIIIFFLGLLVPILFFIIKNTIAGIGDSVAIFIAVVSLVFLVNDEESIGNSILITTIMFVLFV